MSKTFDPTKPVRLRDGRAARIICTDRKNTGFPIIALVSHNNDGKEEVESYTAQGTYYSKHESSSDLVNVLEVVKTYGILFRSANTIAQNPYTVLLYSSEAVRDKTFEAYKHNSTYTAVKKFEHEVEAPNEV
jgi:hypothetical protein